MKSIYNNSSFIKLTLYFLFDSVIPSELLEWDEEARIFIWLQFAISKPDVTILYIYSFNYLTPICAGMFIDLEVVYIKKKTIPNPYQHESLQDEPGNHKASHLEVWNNNKLQADWFVL